MCDSFRYCYSRRSRPGSLPRVCGSLVWSALAIILSTSVSFAQNLVFEDQEFDSVDWQMTTIAHPALGTGYSAVASQRNSGGNPGAYRRVYIHAEGPTGYPVLTVHRWQGAVVDPAVVGEIGEIEYAEDARVEGGSLGQQFQYSGLALIQRGADDVERVFIPSVTLLEASNTAWTRKERLNLFEDQFELVETGDNAGFTREDVHPDFSATGRPISLGFFRVAYSSAATVSFQAAIDNWRVEVKPGPAPNRAPVARTSQMMSAECCKPVTMSGSSSSDPDSGPSPLSYTWEQVSGPTVSLEQSGSDASFTPVKTTADSETYVFKLTVSDGEASDSSQVSVHIASRECLEYCPQWGPCPIKLIGCRIGCIEYTEDRRDSIEARKSVRSSLGSEFVRTYRGVRDKILGASPEGQRYTRLFQEHGPEVVELLLADPVLMAKAQSALRSVQPAFDALLKTPGGSAIITTEQIEEITSLLDTLSASGSPALRDAISTERTRWGPLEAYVGRSTTEVQEALLAYGSFLPRLSSNP